MKKQLFIICLILSAVFTACKEDDDAPPSATANFDFNNCDAPCTVNFINISQNATSYNWNFGDGTTSTEINPTHYYENAGTYNVKLAAAGEGGNHTREKDVVINPPVFKTNYIVDGNAIVAVSGSGSRDFQFNTMNLIAGDSLLAPPFIYFVIKEPASGFMNNQIISIDQASHATGTYAAYSDAAGAMYFSEYNPEGLTLTIDYVNYVNGGVVMGKFSGKLQSSTGDIINITEGEFKIIFSN